MPTPTIETIHHLKSVGIFRDVHAGQFGASFKGYNLIYGFNGCGKTTLSRMIEAISANGLSDNLAPEAEFSFLLSDRTRPSRERPDNAAAPYIFVFNEDFIDRTLTWKTGAAKPIIYIGEAQAELAVKLREAERKALEAHQRNVSANEAWSTASRVLDRHARDAARLIAEELSLGRRYTAANLHSDYASHTITRNEVVAEDERKGLKSLLLQDDPPEKLEIGISAFAMSSVVGDVRRTISIEIGTLALKELERRADALPWIGEGLRLHEAEDNCLFCGESLKKERRDALQAALSSGFDQIAKSIHANASRLEEYSQWSVELRSRMPSPHQTFQQLKDECRSITVGLTSLLERGQAIVAACSDALGKKQANPATILTLSHTSEEEWEAEVSSLMARLVTFCDNHNKLHENFQHSKSEAQRKLKLHFLADGQSTYSEARASEQTLKATQEATEKGLTEAQSEVARLRQELRSHGPAAVELNKCIKGYLGHGRVTVEADEEGYRICRDGKRSRTPLSEGEKTAIAFCYFLTLLKAEGRSLSDLIVVLDDPISSLDTRALTHVGSMIRRRLAGVRQLFILTHNLDFMREMKKWLNKKREEEKAEFLFIETRISADDQRWSRVVEMPKLIREYESEYHYLFSLVLACANDAEASGDFAYLMPNAIRKVLDIFLAFKEPGSSGLESKVNKIIGDYPDLDADRIKAMERLAQLESHADSIGDTATFSAYTIEQVSEGAKCLTSMIEVMDKGHYESMLRLCRRA